MFVDSLIKCWLSRQISINPIKKENIFQNPVVTTLFFDQYWFPWHFPNRVSCALRLLELFRAPKIPPPPPLDSTVFSLMQIVSFYWAYLMWYLNLCHNFVKGVYHYVQNKLMNLCVSEEQDLAVLVCLDVTENIANSYVYQWLKKLYFCFRVLAGMGLN